MNILRRIKVFIAITWISALSILYFNNYPIKIAIGSDIDIYTNAFFVLFIISLMIVIRSLIFRSSIIVRNLCNKIKNVKFKRLLPKGKSN
jgi:hypothetical protein